MFGGVAFNNFGGVRSLGPPWGFCILAQPIINNAVIKTSSFSNEKALFLFSPIFKPYKRFLLFYEDYHSELKKAAAIEYL
jgi:hypothetical protein